MLIHRLFYEGGSQHGGYYIRVGLRPLLRLCLSKSAVAAGTRVPYASPGALTYLVLEVVSRNVYCRVSASYAMRTMP